MAVVGMSTWPVRDFFEEGQFYDELFACGLENLLPFGARLSVRDERKTIFVFSDFGMISAELIETQKFDGWEVYDALSHETFRHESGSDAAAAILRIIRRSKDVSIGREVAP
jgi:hypothetical protein